MSWQVDPGGFTLPPNAQFEGTQRVGNGGFGEQSVSTWFIPNPAAPAASASAPTPAGRIAELTFPEGTYGAAIPLVWGNDRVKGNVIWASPVQENIVPTYTTGADGTQTETDVPHYIVSLAVAFAEGPVDTVTRIWAGDVLIYDAGASGYHVIPPGSTPPFTDTSLVIYGGSATQQPDPTMVGSLGKSNTPACRGLAYFVVTSLDLAPWGNQTPAFSVQTAC